MIKKLILKAFGRKSKEEIKTEQFVDKFKAGTKNLIELLCNKLSQAKNEIKIIREKTKNLLETNYKLGLYHFEKGNLDDAILRFSIIMKFWPNFYEAYYQKAYIQMVKGKALEAKKTMNKLMSKNPSNLDPKFQILNEQIDSALQLKSADE